MAVLFSAVTVTANDDKIELLVSGIPSEYDEIEGWTDFDDFVNLIDNETEVSRSAHSRYKRSICSGLELSVLLSSG